MEHDFNPSIQEAKTDRQISVSSRTIWSIQQIQGQRGLHSEILSKKKKENTVKPEAVACTMCHEQA